MALILTPRVGRVSPEGRPGHTCIHDPLETSFPTFLGTAFRGDHLDQNFRSSKKPLTPSSQECAWGL